MDNRTLCLLYLMGESSPEETAALSDWITEDPEHAQAFALLASQDAYLNTAVGKHCKPVEQSEDLLAELARIEEASGPAHIVDLTHQVEAQRLLEKQQALEAKRYARDESDSRQQRMVLVIPKALVWVGLAAAITVAATLFFQLSDSGDKPIQTAERPIPDQPAPIVQPAFGAVVRSLDANWSIGGDQSGYLRKGGHTLSEGMVELELLSGARVVIEAPTTFVLSGVNAMDIVDGRAVIEVPRNSTGFTLDTPAARFSTTGEKHTAVRTHQAMHPARLNHAGGVQIVRANSILSDDHTEFGVEVIANQQSRAQVYSGEVQTTALVDRTAISEPVSITAGQSATIESGSKPVLVDFDELAFQREITLHLNLTDMVMGGDGKTHRQDVGLNPLTGQYIQQIKDNAALAGMKSSGQVQPVLGNEYIAGVFIPSNDGRMDGLPAGVALADMPKTNGICYGVIWSGLEMPKIIQSYDPIPTNLPGYDFLASGQQAMVMHANSGLIIDLDAIRAQYPEFEIVAMTAVAGISSPRVQAGAYADYRCEFSVFLDSELVKRSSFQRSASDDQRVSTIDTSLHASDRYLTLVSTDGGDGNYLDWVVVGDAQLTLKPKPNNYAF